MADGFASQPVGWISDSSSTINAAKGGCALLIHPTGLVSRRPYKEPWEPQVAAEEIAQGSGIQFDPTVVTAFLELFRRGDFDEIILLAKIDGALPDATHP